MNEAFGFIRFHPLSYGIFRTCFCFSACTDDSLPAFRTRQGPGSNNQRPMCARTPSQFRELDILASPQMNKQGRFMVDQVYLSQNQSI
jgi:hypothetical protein